VYGDEHNVSSAAGVNQSSRGPSQMPTSSDAGGDPNGATSTLAGAPYEGPTGSTSPSCTCGGPSPQSVSVERLPSTAGTAMPPSTATYDRSPDDARPMRTVAPAGTARGRPQSAGRASIVTAHRAPVTASVAAVKARNVQPVSVTSSPAADSGLPTSRFASRSAPRSRAPARGTPKCASPTRPRSCTVVRTPARMTERLLTAVRTELACRE
jgi:hypothetical protein